MLRDWNMKGLKEGWKTKDALLRVISPRSWAHMYNTDLFHFKRVWCFAHKMKQALELVSLNWVLLSSSILDWCIRHTGRRLLGQHEWVRPLLAQKSLGRMTRYQVITSLERPGLCQRRQMASVATIGGGWELCATHPWFCRGDGKLVSHLQPLWCFWATIPPNVLLWSSSEKFTHSSPMPFGSTCWGSLCIFSSVFLFSFVLQDVNIIQQRWEGIGHMVQHFQLLETAWTIQGTHNF